jgi:hypothetical protein
MLRELLADFGSPTPKNIMIILEGRQYYRLQTKSLNEYFILLKSCVRQQESIPFSQTLPRTSFCVWLSMEGDMSPLLLRSINMLLSTLSQLMG